jgi:hypothetical protein
VHYLLNEIVPRSASDVSYRGVHQIPPPPQKKIRNVYSSGHCLVTGVTKKLVQPPVRGPGNYGPPLMANNGLVASEYCITIV